MAKTQQQYYDEIYAEGKKSLDKLHEQKKTTDAETLKQIEAGIDKATATSTAQYQQRIDAAPLESRKLYDQNAISDAVSKKRVQESLANMGLTDSGLTSSMQTALAIQKQKADATVRRDEAAKVQSYQNAIDQIIADGEAKKSDARISAEKATADWYSGALAELENSSRTSAADAYAADMDYAAKVYDAQQKYGAQVVKDQNAANEKQQKAMQDTVNGYIEDGYDNLTAMAMANELYPTGDAYTDTYYAAIRNGYTDAEAKAYAAAGGGDAGEEVVRLSAGENAQRFVQGLQLDVTDGWFNTTWKTLTSRGGHGDGDAVSDRIKELTENDKRFKSMSSTEKELATCIAIAESVNTSWAKAGDHEKNYERIKRACSNLGVDYEFTKNYYDEIR